MLRALSCLSVVSLCGLASAAVVSPPYSDNFNSDPVGANAPNLVSNPSGTFTVVSPATTVTGGSGNAYRFNQTFTSGSSVTRGPGSSVDFGTSTAGKSFSESSLIRFDSATGNNNGNSTTGRIGLAAATGTADGFNVFNGYAADLIVFNSTASPALGGIRIFKSGTNSTTLGTATTTGGITSVAPGNVFRFIFGGAYASPTTLNLSLTVQKLDSAGNVSQTATTTVTDATAFTNLQQFGYRYSVPGASTGTSTLVATADNFSIAVPEPTSAALIGLGLAGLALRRRR